MARLETRTPSSTISAVNEGANVSSRSRFRSIIVSPWAGRLTGVDTYVKHKWTNLAEIRRGELTDNLLGPCRMTAM